MAVSGGPSNTTDWVGLYAAGAADPSFLEFRYLNGTTPPPTAGVSAATLSFTTPTSPGDYEFRFFANNGYGRLATSSVATVAPSSASVTVNGIAPPAPVTAVAGSVATIDVANGPGNPSDWVGLFMEGSPGGSFLEWKYLNGSGALPPTGVSTR